MKSQKGTPQRKEKKRENQQQNKTEICCLQDLNASELNLFKVILKKSNVVKSLLLYAHAGMTAFAASRTLLISKLLDVEDTMTINLENMSNGT